MPTIKVTDATVEPITLAEAKQWCRVHVDDDDGLFTSLCIPAARQDAERYLRRTLLPTTWRLVLDGFPTGRIELQYPNLLAVTSVKHFDLTGTEQTLQTQSYLVDSFSQPGTIAPAPGTQWPTAQDRINAVSIEYTAGWATPQEVPAAIRMWIALRAATLYEHREMIIAGATVAEVPFVNNLLDGYTVYSL
jgi:uncharacterized phiE125 gp8 family phage protein